MSPGFSAVALARFFFVIHWCVCDSFATTNSSHSEPRLCGVGIDGSIARVAVVFFGLPRSLPFTLPSIKRHVFSALLRNHIAFDVFSFTLDAATVFNHNTGYEAAKTDGTEIFQLHPCRFSIADQDSVQTREYELFMKAREISDTHSYDIFKDSHNSIKNLLGAYFTQAQSIKLISEYSERNNISFDAVLAIRPDTAIIKDIDLIDNIDEIKQNPNSIFIPNFAFFGGYCDRAAYGSYEVMKKYLNRGKLFRDSKWDKNGESFLKHFIEVEGLGYKPSLMRVIRIRADGSIAPGSSGDLKAIHLNVADDDPDYNRCVDYKNRIFNYLDC